MAFEQYSEIGQKTLERLSEISVQNYFLSAETLFTCRIHSKEHTGRSIKHSFTPFADIGRTQTEHWYKGRVTLQS